MAYTEQGLFVVKVGNLTGQGVSWRPRERNFVGEQEANRRRRGRALLLQRFDILLTSSAHSSRYIAKKTDIVVDLPYGEASFVGEVALIRVKPGVLDPFVLLAYLRHPQTVARLQSLVRGQTAHLLPADLLRFRLPESLLSMAPGIQECANLLRQEADLAAQLDRTSGKLEARLADKPW
jgi:type I restriction enzyme M protein